jgi:hypothetical protein
MMNYEAKTICDHIDCLARLTGAPDSFVVQVKELFGRKGISLHEDAEPYIKALEEAFRREETIRASALRARQNLSSMSDNFQKIGRAYVEQLSRPRKSAAEPHASARRPRSKTATSRPTAHQITIQGDHRTYVTRTEREELPMVPGPDDMQ